jgi:hypothetical protein
MAIIDRFALLMTHEDRAGSDARSLPAARPT